MSETRDLFNHLAHTLEQELLSEEGKCGDTDEAAEGFHLEALLMAEMSRDKPDAEKIMKLLDRKARFLKRTKMAKSSFLKREQKGTEEPAAPASQKSAKDNNMHWSALMTAAYYGREHDIERLIRNGASLTHTNEDGVSAFALAKARGNGNVLELLEFATSVIARLEHITHKRHLEDLESDEAHRKANMLAAPKNH